MQKIFLSLAYVLLRFGCAISNETSVAGEHRRGSLAAAAFKGGRTLLKPPSSSRKAV